MNVRHLEAPCGRFANVRHKKLPRAPRGNGRTEHISSHISVMQKDFDGCWRKLWSKTKILHMKNICFNKQAPPNSVGLVLHYLIYYILLNSARVPDLKSLAFTSTASFSSEMLSVFSCNLFAFTAFESLLSLHSSRAVFPSIQAVDKRP